MSGFHAGSASLEELYAAHSDGLFAFLCSRVRDAHAAQDILHDVFVAYFRRPAGQPIASPKAYLYRSAERLSANFVRDRGKERQVHGLLAARQSGWRPAAGADRAIFAEAHTALAALPVPERDAIVLRVFGSMTFEEAAEALGLPLATVHDRYERGMRSLRLAVGEGSRQKGIQP